MDFGAYDILGGAVSKIYDLGWRWDSISHGTGCENLGLQMCGNDMHKKLGNV